MKINEVEALTDIPKKSIRYYEEEGLLRPARDALNGYRSFDAQDVARLKRIKLGRKLGLPVEEIGRILSGSLTWREALERQNIVLAHERNDLEKQRVLCERLIAQLETGVEPDADAFLASMAELERGGVRFTDYTAVDRRKELRGVWLSCAGFALFLLAIAALVWWAAASDPMPIWAFVLMETLILLHAVGIAAAGRTRIREIKGGETDDLGKY